VSIEISQALRRELDEVPVSRLAEYLCARLQLDEGEKALLLSFKNGRYDRMKPYAAVKAGYPSSGV
jgi:hypothetical protein